MVAILMYFSLFGVIVAYKEDIRHRSLREKDELDRRLGLVPISNHSAPKRSKQEIMDEWYEDQVL
jgi:hypothetical protein